MGLSSRDHIARPESLPETTLRASLLNWDLFRIQIYICLGYQNITFNLFTRKLITETPRVLNSGLKPCGGKKLCGKKTKKWFTELNVLNVTGAKTQSLLLTLNYWPSQRKSWGWSRNITITFINACIFSLVRLWFRAFQHNPVVKPEPFRSTDDFYSVFYQSWAGLTEGGGQVFSC